MIKKYFFKQNSALYFIPFVAILVYCLISSINFNLHDFSNSYFSARLISDNLNSDKLFDIYEFNNYIWNLGYDDVLVDFYLNSPFTITVFYPLTFIENAYTAKLVFNIFSIILFTLSMYLLIKLKFKKKYWILLVLPFIFFIPIRNQILFGQSYFLVFSLIIFGFLFMENKREGIGASLISVAVLLKIFPVFYGVTLLFYKSWKAVLIGILTLLILVLFSIYISGFSLWETYVMEIIPNAIQNNSTVDFRYNAQSFDVLLRTLFIEDAYYNPNALFNNERLYVLIKWVFKSVIIAYAIGLSFKNKSNLFKLLSIWIVALFLLQSRTATYAQILWIVPAICFLNQKISTVKKIVFLLVLFIVCNIPVYKLESLPIVFKFSRLGFTLLLAFLFYSSFSVKLNLKWLVGVFIALTPLHLKVFENNKTIKSEYVLAEKEHFLVYDFFEKDETLFIKTLGKNGEEIVSTNIPLTSFNENIFEIEGNQILLEDKVILEDYSLKKKPVLVNNTTVYYLTDHHSRRGAYTLKKLSIEEIH
tara:strand:- start:1629 stop:3224 length:1596 start_codon:yes stop_codon:yes gene_type:complete